MCQLHTFRRLSFLRGTTIRRLLTTVAFLLLAGLSGGAAIGQELDWAVRAGGTSDDRGSGIAVDGSGNSYVTGLFVGTATFGSGETNETALTSVGSGDIFVAKYDANGALLWAKRAGGISSDGGRGISVDGTGNSYITGSFASTATFGAGEANQTKLISPGNSDIFVAKYDAAGALVWAKRAGGDTGGDVGRGIASDGSGNSYVTGDFTGTATFGAGEANETTLTSGGSVEIFVAKYDAAGALVWAKQAGGGVDKGFDEGFGIAVDGSGNSYVTGSFLGTATFGAGEANETTPTSAGSRDIFVAKYDAAGALVWAKRAGGTGGDRGVGIAVDGSGNSYVTGEFAGTATFGPGETNETPLISAGSADIFVAKYGADSDEAGPITSNVVADPNPASVNEAITLSAKIDDSTTGGSNIASADFEIRDENGAVVHSGAGNNTDCPSPEHLCTVDEFGTPEASPAFDAVMEDVEVYIAAGTLSPGVYDACVRGTDANGNTGDFECAYLVVYDPDGGFVTGGGWIYSEPGFCSLDALCASAVGKANFGFVSKYKKGAKVPTGQTQFQFKAGGLNFHSTEYEWLVVSGAMAQYKGSGTINGAGDYGFLLTAQDSAINGGPEKDTFRIKIWDKATETIVYDNGSDQPIGGGSIVIHTK